MERKSNEMMNIPGFKNMKNVIPLLLKYALENLTKDHIMSAFKRVGIDGEAGLITGRYNKDLIDKRYHGNSFD